MSQTLLLLTTTDASAGRSAALSRLLASLEAARRGVALRLFLLLQGVDGNAGEFLTAAEREFVDMTSVPGRMSLSAARNLLSARAFASFPESEPAIVAYPDDDCWYPPGALARLAAAFDADDALDFRFCRYGSQPTEGAGPPPRQARADDVIRFASSNTIAVRASLARKLPPFDEAYGVGALHPGAEDTDYALEAWLAARRTIFVDAPLVGHRDRNPMLRAKYYGPSFAIIARHAARDMRLAAPLVRKLFVGAALVAKGELKPGALVSAVGLAAREAAAGPARKLTKN